MAVIFDLDQVDKASREDTLNALMSQIPVPIDVRSRSVDDLHVATVSDYFGGVFLVSCNGRGALVERGERRAKEDHTRCMMLSVVAAGRSRLQQADRISDISTGDVIPYTSDRPYRATFNNVAKHTYMIEYSALDLPEKVLNAQLARRLNAGHALGTIVSRYLTELGTRGIYLSDQDRSALERPTLDLLRALFSSTSGDESLAREPLHASLGTRMIEYVKMHLREPDLNIARVAREHGISERYAYLILSKSGISLGQWVRSQRLTGAARELSTGPPFGQSISAIAYRWGFPDHANFTRAFRRSYGMSPRDYRRLQRPNRGPVEP